MTRTLIFAAAVSLLAAAPVLAAGTPDGDWTCSIAGAPAGTLSISALDYSFTSAGGAAGSGTYTIGDTMMIHVADGPLKDLGVTLGYFGVTQTPATLTFSMGPGKGMSCALA